MSREKMSRDREFQNKVALVGRRRAPSREVEATITAAGEKTSRRRTRADRKHRYMVSLTMRIQAG